jgi:hypothetical protein
MRQGYRTGPARFIGAGAVCASMICGGAVLAADVVPLPPPPPPPIESPGGWTVDFVPYGWTMFLKGDVTARGREAGIDTNIFEILDVAQLNGAWMSYLEARNGPFTVYLDTIWSDLSLSRELVGQRNPVAGLTISATADVGLQFEMAIVEAGAGYEIGRWPADAGGLTTLDVTGGFRYWHLETSVNFDVAAGVNLANLGLTGTAGGQAAASGGADWIDPVIGLEFRHVPSPGTEISLAGDIGGFGIGSDFTWQAEAMYRRDLGDHGGHQWFGELGYRALSVDYSDGSGNARKGWDMLIHGPVLALGMRW